MIPCTYQSELQSPGPQLQLCPPDIHVLVYAQTHGPVHGEGHFGGTDGENALKLSQAPTTPVIVNDPVLTCCIKRLRETTCIANTVSLSTIDCWPWSFSINVPPDWLTDYFRTSSLRIGTGFESYQAIDLSGAGIFKIAYSHIDVGRED